MKAIVFAPNLAGGGAEKIAVELYTYLNNQIEFDKVLFVLQTGEIEYSFKGVENVSILETRNTPFSFLRFYWLTKKAKPDVVISFLVGPNLINIMASKLLKYRGIITVHNNTSVERSSYKGFKTKLMTAGIRRLYKKADKVISVSKGVNTDLISNFGVDPAITEVIYNPTSDQPLKVREIQSPFKNADPVIIAIGRFNEVKQFPQLVNTFSKVLKQVPCNLLILGEGEEREKIQREILNLKLKERIALPGFTDNVYGYLNLSQLFVLCSTREGFGNVIIEAMKAGKPIVSFDVPFGPGEILAGGEFGILVKNQDWNELEEKMVILLKNPKMLREFSHLSTKRSKHFSTEKSLMKYKSAIVGGVL